MERDQAVEQATLVYIPMDRRQALARGVTLPDRTRGAALFADISGFTPLTEALTRTLGPRRGAEELTRQLNWVYDALIAEVSRYGGSVIGFAGDAITCWFGEEMAQAADVAVKSAPLRATACALAMQDAMEQFAVVELPAGETVSLAMKASVASGPARRFQVGEPTIQLVDALVGDTLTRVAAGEHLADRGDVVVDAQTVDALGERGQVVEWRTDSETGERFAVVTGLTERVSPTPWSNIAPQMLANSQVRPWLLPAVYERLRDELGEFLLELRPGVVTLFLRFEGIDYEGDEEAESKLDGFIRWVQGLLARYDGALLQLIIGDKGSYLYAAFGAPIAHEDDARRAVLAALELHAPPPDLDFIRAVQIGISQGRMRTGAYGGATRRTYGVLGDEVNLAARLMQYAAPGEVLVSRRVQKGAGDGFSWDVLSPIRVKGKGEPVPVVRLIGVRDTRTESEPAAYQGDLVGRESEVAQLLQFLDPLLTTPAGGFAGMVYVYGEAGVGKTRLLYEVRRRLADEFGDVVQWFTCPAEQILRQSLYPFKHFLREYFDQHADNSEEENKASFGEQLDDLIVDLQNQDWIEMARELERTRSFLGGLVDLRWEGSLYEQLEPKLRFENSLAAFKTLIAAESLRRPAVLDIEDAHWLDADSYELLRVLVRNVGPYPFAVLLSGRYRDDGSRFTVDVDEGVVQGAIDLNVLSTEVIRELAAQVLEGPIAGELADFLAEKTNGNPLFVEQLALDMRERDLLSIGNEGWSVAGQDVEVPASISAVLIARLDRLAAQVKAVVQTAAVLGREFEIQVLSQILRDDQELPQKVKRAEAEQVWLALSEMRYLFRHTLMRDAAYDMQLQSRLQEMHALAGWAIEEVYAADLGPHYADLAYHYGMAGETEREFQYAKLAGEHAVAQFANQEAISYFNRALQSAARLDSVETSEQRQEIYLALGEVLTTTGQYEQAQVHLDQALGLAVERGDRDGEAHTCRWLAQLYELRGEYPTALEWIQRGLSILEVRETVEVAELLLIAGLIHTRQGDYDNALIRCQRALGIAEALDKVTTVARAYNLLGHIARLRGNNAEAIEHFQQSLYLYQQAKDMRGQALAHNQVANAYSDLAQWREAEHQYQQARQIFDQIGDVYYRAFVDNNLGEIARTQGRLDEALEFYQAGLRSVEQIGGSLWVLGGFHNNLGATYIRRGDIDVARQHLQMAQEYFEQAQARDWLPELYCHWAEADLVAGKLSEAGARGQQALDLSQELEMRGEEGACLRVLGKVALAQQQFDRAEEYFQQSISMLSEVGDEYGQARSRLALAQLRVNQGDVVDALSDLDWSVPVFERLGAALDLAMAHELQQRLESADTVS